MFSHSKKTPIVPILTFLAWYDEPDGDESEGAGGAEASVKW